LWLTRATRDPWQVLVKSVAHIFGVRRDVKNVVPLVFPGRLSFAAGFLLKKSAFLPEELREIRRILTVDAVASGNASRNRSVVLI